MAKTVLLGLISCVPIAAPAIAQPTSPPASTAFLGGGHPCVILPSTTGGTHAVTGAKVSAPVAVANTTGVRKPFKLINGDPDLPTTAHPGGDETLGSQIDDQNAHNPASGMPSSDGGSGSSNGSGSGGSGSGHGSGGCR